MFLMALLLPLLLLSPSSIFTAHNKFNLTSVPCILSYYSPVTGPVILWWVLELGTVTTATLLPCLFPMNRIELCDCIVTVLLLHCYRTVTVLLLHCYCIVTALLPHCYCISCIATDQLQKCHYRSAVPAWHISDISYITSISGPFLLLFYKLV